MSENARSVFLQSGLVARGQAPAPRGDSRSRAPPAAACLLAWDGHRREAFAPPWLICRRQSGRVPPRERRARSGRHVGSSAGLCALGTGRADPTWAQRLLAAGWEAPANTDQKIRSWFCCSSRSQPVKDNRKR